MPWRPDFKLLVIGDVFVDYSAPDRRVRLGGVFHAARALNAFGLTFGLGCFAPSYLNDAIAKFGRKLGAAATSCIGEVRGSPAVVVVAEPSEAGNQGYDEILRDERATGFDVSALLGLIAEVSPTDVLLFPGQYPAADVLAALAQHDVAVHCDTQYAADLVSMVGGLRRPLNTVFVSTSSQTFHKAASDAATLRSGLVPTVAETLVLKENRGGSRATSPRFGWVHGPSFPTRTAHSIGVGDCFDCAWLAAVESDTPERALTRAAYMSSLYAATWDHSAFVDNVRAAMSVDDLVAELTGVRLEWETRPNHHVYLAAPDFPGINVRPLDELERALRYHNFSPHRPVREHGLVVSTTSAAEAADVYRNDVALLDSAALLIAVPIAPDPGTFVELGLAHGRGIPTILWNHGSSVANLFALKTADRVCDDLPGVIDAVFELLGRRSIGAVP